MKKTIITIKIAAIAISVALMASCSDLLDQRPQGEWTEDDIEGSAYFSQVMGLYSTARSYNITAGIPAFAFHYYRSEDSRKGSSNTDGTEHPPMWDYFQYTAGNSLLKAYWNECYSIINNSNTVLHKMKNAEDAGTALTADENINRMEAQFFRAWSYFNLVRAFGEVPLIDFYISNSDEANIAKASSNEIYALIDSDLSEAEGLPAQWDSKYVGRLTSGAAHALHAKVYAQRGMWAQMYASAKIVIDSHKYDLSTPFEKIFREDGENSSESVWEMQCTATTAEPASNKIGSQFCEVQGLRGTGDSNLGWGWHMADESLADVFETGDPRRDETLLYFSAPDRAWPSIAPSTGNAPFGEFLVGQPDLDGAYGNKKAYCSPVLRKQFGSKSGHWYNIRMIRYSDVVLMAAEAACEMGGAANINEALDLLEQVRSRARGTNTAVLPKVTTTVQADLRAAIHHERHVELALEFDRFYDLVRWDQAGVGDVDGARVVLGPLGYTDKNAYLPISQEIIDASNGVLVQNPDWVN